MMNLTMTRKTVFLVGPLAAALTIGAVSLPAHAAIALDRTRVIFDGDLKTVSLNISNQNKQLPYLAQGWIEDDRGNKIQSPFTVLPPVQRVEPGKPSQVKIQSLPAARQLPQDRETLYYFNLREIPPRSNKPNTLQIALQTRIKMFYRPAALAPKKNAAPWQEQLTLTRQGDKYVVNNPTPYYVTIVEASAGKGGKGAAGFEPLMVAPKASAPLNVSAASLGNGPSLAYINDYGGRPQLNFRCAGNACQVVPVAK
ncbi:MULTISPECIES: fimbria/pilus periplasmic chaperone [Serratia]|jgi:chaperone protein PapD|uniref:Fimbria/pilus periplasmic chaperone n=6 Tax=Serratia TaxID=613 RepID=A0A0M4QLH3_SERMA|nr:MULTISPECIES: fimbria/pilus periplasmic chaperone [Serratia]RNW14999.1 molecular chaperone [Serratia nematodiphila]ALE95342.1 fimbrial chaperone protein [Serratia marcescens]AQT63241.1 molecular chaperone [Serratia marcescens]ASL87019.1 molecular chaperone [Serratia marcescens]ASL96964.1 molecular chaperone [Serratia marcescens]